MHIHDKRLGSNTLHTAPDDTEAHRVTWQEKMRVLPRNPRELSEPICRKDYLNREYL
jgi:hypothetical protein